jgi:hypothetical protein
LPSSSSSSSSAAQSPPTIFKLRWLTFMLSHGTNTKRTRDCRVDTHRVFAHY